MLLQTPIFFINFFSFLGNIKKIIIALHWSDPVIYIYMYIYIYNCNIGLSMGSASPAEAVIKRFVNFLIHHP